MYVPSRVGGDFALQWNWSELVWTVPAGGLPVWTTDFDHVDVGNVSVGLIEWIGLCDSDLCRIDL